jgi:AraC family transcriptional activator of pobA
LATFAFQFNAVAKTNIPVYDIKMIEPNADKDLLVARLGGYLKKHYPQLHTPHRHSFYHIVLFTKGKGGHTIDFEKFSVNPYQIYFMIPGQVHSWHFENGVDGYIVHFNEALFTTFLQHKDYLERFYFLRGHAENAVCQIPAAQQAGVERLFKSLLCEATENEQPDIDMLRLRLLELFITIGRTCSSKKSKSVPQQKLTVLRSFQQLIDKNYRTIRLPKEYADLLYITPNHLNALCQDLIGKTAGELIRNRTLLEAKRLLTNSDMTVTEIAYDLHFEDNSYFNRFFKKSEGITPEEFRKKFIHQ